VFALDKPYTIINTNISSVVFHLKVFNMAKLKKAVRKTATRSKTSKATPKSRFDASTSNLIDTAQQIWTAGVGALARAQGEGTDLFENLVKKGMKLEAKTRKLANGKVDVVRGAVEGRVENVREKATDTWDRMEKVFEDRVQQALNRLGVPTREDLTSLTKRVESLTAELRKQGGKAPTAKKAAAPAKKAAAPAKKASSPAKKAVKKVAKKASKVSLPKAPTPVAPNA
jgi:poly(hydroxyalkanoate) granule-associated protein